MADSSGSLRLCVAALLVVVFPCISYAQANDRGGHSLPRVFIGTGVAPATNDGASRMRLSGEGSSLVWLVEAGAALSSRVGIGVELAHPTAVETTTSGQSFRSFGRQEERVLIGLVRTRALQSDRWALDVMFGAGLLTQHHELRISPCFRGCEDTEREELHHQAPAFGLGAEVPLRVGRHLWVSGVSRWYALRRGEHMTQVPVLIPWQYEWQSSTRVAVGVTGRAGW